MLSKCENPSVNIQSTLKTVCKTMCAKPVFLWQDGRRRQSSWKLAGHIAWCMQCLTVEILFQERWKKPESTNFDVKSPV